MRIDPQVVGGHRFRTARRGYDRAEVDAVMSRLAQALRAYEARVADLERRLAAAETGTPAVTEEEARALLAAADASATERLAAAEAAARELVAGAEERARALEATTAARFGDTFADVERRLVEAAGEGDALRRDAEALMAFAAMDTAALREAAAAEAEGLVAAARREAEAVLVEAREGALDVLGEARETAAELLADAAAQRAELEGRLRALGEALGMVEGAVVDLTTAAQRARPAAAVAVEDAVVDGSTVTSGGEASGDLAAVVGGGTAPLVDPGTIVSAPDGSGRLPVDRPVVHSEDADPPGAPTRYQRRGAGLRSRLARARGG